MDLSHSIKIPLYVFDDPQAVQRILHGLRYKTVEALMQELPYGRYHVVRFDEIWPEEYLLFGLDYYRGRYYDRMFEPPSITVILKVQVIEVQTENVTMRYITETPHAKIEGPTLWKPFKWLNEQFKRAERDIKNFK